MRDPGKLNAKATARRAYLSQSRCSSDRSAGAASRMARAIASGWCPVIRRRTAIPERMAALERETAAMRNDVGAIREALPPRLVSPADDRSLLGRQPSDDGPLDQDGQGAGRESRRHCPRRPVAPPRVWTTLPLPALPAPP